MADVLIVCVREDEPQAKSLADMFERAGFSVGGAPSNDGALRSSGAAVVVWSQASIRSRPFLDAAQRVVNAKKAVVACLIEPPPAASINDSPSFDLRGWSGDPDDPMLDPLFFGVDRMVNSARAAVGAPAAQPAPEPFEPPPSLRPPPSTPPYARSTRTAPPQTRQPPQAPMPPGFQMRSAQQAPPPVRVRTETPTPNDPLGSEAEHWRAIRHSNDPTVFLDYLAKYGPDGAFSELAENRLKQLEPNAPANLRTAARGLAEPAPQQQPPQQRRETTRRREREPAFEAIPESPRYYDRRDEKRAQQPKQGGGIRLLVLFVLLGGGALAGGLYFGMQPGQFGGLSAVHDDAQSSSAPTSSGAQQSAPADAPQSDASTDQSGAQNFASDPTPPRIEVASNTHPPQATPARPQQQVQRQGDPSDSETPPPQTSWTNSAPANNNAGAGGSTYTGGPVSLMPNPANDSAGQQSSTPVSLPAQAATPANAPVSRGVITWAQRPSAARFAALYPDGAARRGVGGRVELDCTIRDDLGAACTVMSETPPGQGFARAALSLVSSFRAEHFLSDGAPAAGTHVRVPIVFQPPN